MALQQQVNVQGKATETVLGSKRQVITIVPQQKGLQPEALQYFAKGSNNNSSINIILVAVSER